ncbi:putative thioredoxin-like protein HCF164, chloroplastic [Iris pallida]|uniref:Thioredoxin-like protein HCF164, chloroplastic n=1 Tax=Iris pallida TaxID=29817 RepID=A0AAX6ER70_IRIPA|nr:putative thioredoxin-like protein HCF164, chloroplastic [Iris pallida]
MARVASASSSLGLPQDSGPRLRYRSRHRHPITPTPLSLPLRSRSGPRSLSRQAKPDPVEPTSTTDNTILQPDTVEVDNKDGSVAEIPEANILPNKDINRRIALGTSFAAVGLFLSRKLDFGVSLQDLSAVAMPYEEALSNGLPTVVEFYADWCEVCRELAPDVYKVEQQYKNRVNFVMLNVDNTKWEQELDEFGVEGIPHFAFLDAKGNEEGNVVGRLPRKYLLENVDALANGDPSIPHARVVGQYTSADSRKVHQVVDPRSHG